MIFLVVNKILGSDFGVQTLVWQNQAKAWTPFEVSVFLRKTETSNALALGK
jgi:uncharacterized membrane protein